MASGTPVLSLHRGAAPEIITDGKTGFICDSLSEMVSAVGKLDSIDRKACRRRVEEKFSYSVMVDRYEKVLLNFLDGSSSDEQPATKARAVLREQIKRVKHLVS